jgi:L-lactate permease
MSLSLFLQVIIDVAKQIKIPAATVCVVLAMAFLMNYSGETAIIGLAFAHTGAIFPFFSAALGWLGVFLTGSDTSSNALFGNLQVVTATRLQINPAIMAASNSVGGVVGKMISLQTIAVAAAATGLDHMAQNGLFRRMLRHSLLLTAFAGLLALIAVHVLSR